MEAPVNTTSANTQQINLILDLSSYQRAVQLLGLWRRKPFRVLAMSNWICLGIVSSHLHFPGVSNQLFDRVLKLQWPFWVSPSIWKGKMAISRSLAQSTSHSWITITLTMVSESRQRNRRRTTWRICMAIVGTLFYFIHTEDSNGSLSVIYAYLTSVSGVDEPISSIGDGNGTIDDASIVLADRESFRKTKHSGWVYNVRPLPTSCRCLG